MGPLFMNKVAAAILVGILMIMVINTFTESAMHVDVPEQVAFPVTVATEDASAATDAVVEVSIADLMAAADAGKGKRQFAKCKSCHTVDEGGRNGTGPNLYGIVNAAVGGKDGYNYSAALKGAGGTWTLEALDAWLANPKKAIPGNKMSFAGVRRPGQRADLIAYLIENGPQ